MPQICNVFTLRVTFLIVSASLFLLSFLLNLNIFLFGNPSLWTNQQTGEQLNCMRNAPSFQQAMDLQQQGLAELRLTNGSVNLRGTWKLIQRHFNTIWGEQFAQMRVHQLYSDGEERKYFAAFSPSLRFPRTCNVVTLGVGHSVWAERNLSMLYPECRFLAADPSQDINAELVREMGGTFVHAAVGGKSAKGQPANVWEKDIALTRHAERKSVTQLGIVDFLEVHLGDKSELDLMLVDVEGAEFGILEQMVDNPHLVPLPICQLNVEVHHPDYLIAKYTHQRFFRYFDRLMRSGRYALLHTDVYEDAQLLFLRLFLVNVVDEKCTRKFLC